MGLNDINMIVSKFWTKIEIFTKKTLGIYLALIYIVANLCGNTNIASNINVVLNVLAPKYCS